MPATYSTLRLGSYAYPKNIRQSQRTNTQALIKTVLEDLSIAQYSSLFVVTISTFPDKSFYVLLIKYLIHFWQKEQA